MPVEINGVDELQRALLEKATLSDVKRVVRVNGAELQRKSKRNAPVRYGFLERSIKLTFENNGFTARVTANADYAGYVEFGTRFMYPRWYMQRAFYNQVRKFKKDLNRLFK